MKQLGARARAHQVKRSRQGQNAWKTPRNRRADAAKSRFLNLKVVSERRLLGFRAGGGSVTTSALGASFLQTRFNALAEALAR